MINNYLDSSKGQFILTQNAEFIVDGWNIQEKYSWLLSSHPSLPVLPILDEDDQHLGWILGYSIETQKSNLLFEHLYLDTRLYKGINTDLIESMLNKIGGRFLVIILTNEIKRLYLDASGSLSAVYSLDRPVIASTPNLLEKKITRQDESTLKIIKQAMASSGNWYPCSLTPLKQVKVLLPNHYIDLQNWHVKRHWPQKHIQQVSSNFKKNNNTIRSIVAIITNHISAIAKHYPLHLNLTSGKDTRMLLACSRNLVDSILFSTSYNNNTNQPDIVISKTLAEIFDLNYVVNPPNYIDRVLLTGFAGEVGRAFYWQDQDDNTKSIHPQDILIRLNYKEVHPILIQELSSWLLELPELNIFSILDLMYIEQRLGCCMGRVMYSCDQISKFSLYPMNSRLLFELMLNLPISYKKKKLMAKDVCEIAWSDLLDIPFHSLHFTGILRYKKLFKYLCNLFLINSVEQKEKNKKILYLIINDKLFLNNLLDKIIGYI
ncbi:MAG: hypothetical protein RIM23_25595 [Coleofasciculus sp. G3-WIS-01]|uniref:hypothetical protein n=1 Tax=Coleofasciculus sp. G3-WIS-01 TaxID=3069528 RepID=UPI00330347EC